VLAAIGAVPLVILAIALISIVVMNFLFLLGAKI